MAELASSAAVTHLYQCLIDKLPKCRHCGDVCILFGMDDLSLPVFWPDLNEPVTIDAELAEYHRRIAAMAREGKITDKHRAYVRATLCIP